MRTKTVKQHAVRQHPGGEIRKDHEMMAVRELAVAHAGIVIASALRTQFSFC
jgi:hypothetical protein